MSELSHFEQESTKTPTKQPYAILGGFVLLVIALMLLNALAPNEAIEEAKANQEAAAAPAAAAPAADDDEI
jgi:hypothetical protein